jgi:maltose O-acetyltransferase
MFRYFINFVLNALPPTRLFGFRRRLLGIAGVEMGRGARVCGPSWIFGRGQFHVGDDSWISPGLVVYTHLSAPVRIGSGCDVGHNVTIITGSHEFGTAARRAGAEFASPIVIGDGTWIGARSTLLAGVNIGVGCMVAAGSVVTRDIPDNCFAAGVPAKIKRKFSN